MRISIILEKVYVTKPSVNVRSLAKKGHSAHDCLIS